MFICPSFDSYFTVHGCERQPFKSFLIENLLYRSILLLFFTAVWKSAIIALKIYLLLCLFIPKKAWIFSAARIFLLLFDSPCLSGSSLESEMSSVHSFASLPHLKLSSLCVFLVLISWFLLSAFHPCCICRM